MRFLLCVLPINLFNQDISGTLRLLTPAMETPDPPSDISAASKQVVLTPHDIPRILRVTGSSLI